MPQELELKLSLRPSDQHRFAKLPMLQREAAAVVEQLYNAYYDTPDRQLQQARIALRIRRRGEQFIQTLKTQGNASGGLHDRQEWEWILPQAVLDTELVRAVLPDTKVELEQLGTLFSTDFQRSHWLLQQGESAIELALDDGWVSCGDKRDRISEVELELKSGDAATLFATAAELATQIPLRIGRISKAERGYRLLGLRPGAPAAMASSLSEALDLVQQCLEDQEFQPSQQHQDAVTQGLQQLLAHAETIPEIAEQRAVLQQTLAQFTNQTEQVDSAEDPLWQQPFCQALLALSRYCYEIKQ